MEKWSVGGCKSAEESQPASWRTPRTVSQPKDQTQESGNPRPAKLVVDEVEDLYESPAQDKKITTTTTKKKRRNQLKEAKEEKEKKQTKKQTKTTKAPTKEERQG